MHVVKTAAQDANDVANGGASGRSDESDAARKNRQRFFVFRVEETFGFETFFELIERKLQSADAERLHAFAVNLIFAALLVDADAAAECYLHAVFDAEFDAAAILLEPNATDLGLFILERELKMAGLSFTAIGDFPFDAELREILGKKIANARGKFADGERAAGGVGGERGLGPRQGAGGSGRGATRGGRGRGGGRDPALEWKHR